MKGLFSKKKKNKDAERNSLPHPQKEDLDKKLEIKKDLSCRFMNAKHWRSGLMGLPSLSGSLTAQNHTSYHKVQCSRIILRRFPEANDWGVVQAAAIRRMVKESWHLSPEHAHPVIPGVHSRIHPKRPVFNPAAVVRSL